MKRALVVTLVVLVCIGGLTAWVVVPVAARLRDVEDAIAEGNADLQGPRLAAARADLRTARDRLQSLPAKVLRFVPLVGANVDAVGSVTEALIPVVDTAVRLERSSRSFRKGGFVSGGRFRADDLAALSGPLSDEVVALQQLEIAARDSMTGAVLPPLWDRLATIADRASQLRRRLDDAATLVRRAPRLLGVGNPRRYLVMLLNNAELRGAGGILAGIGSIRFVEGRIELEKMFSVHDLDVEPRITVPAPSTYERRFGQFQANTTLWLNTTFSPDVPDVATVASRLFERVTGKRTSGALLLDPRGLAALLDEDAELELDNLGKVSAEDLPRVVYSDAYDVFTDQVQRRNAILELGVEAFERFVADGVPEDGIDAIGDAVAGGHLGFVAFDDVEGRALAGVGAAHDLPAVAGDTLLVTAQNFGYRDEGTKLDYWVDRTVQHSCELDAEVATCATTVRFENKAPKGLTTFVAGVPYGLLRSYVEIYVPGSAELDEVRVDGRAANFRPELHEDMLSLGVYIEIPRTESVEVSSFYRLRLGDRGYRLVATPQPLARDADLSISVGIPDGWSATGAGTVRDGVLRVTGPFDAPLDIAARPDDRTGVSALWENLVSFWNEPVI